MSGIVARSCHLCCSRRDRRSGRRPGIRWVSRSCDGRPNELPHSLSGSPIRASGCAVSPGTIHTDSGRSGRLSRPLPATPVSLRGPISSLPLPRAPSRRPPGWAPASPSVITPLTVCFGPRGSRGRETRRLARLTFRACFTDTRRVHGGHTEPGLALPTDKHPKALCKQQSALLFLWTAALSHVQWPQSFQSTGHIG